MENAISIDEVRNNTVLITLRVEPETETRDQAAQLIAKYGTTEEKWGATMFTDFVDATLTKQINNGPSKKIMETNGVIQIHIPLSERLMELIDKYDLDPQNTQVYRAHEVNGTTLEQLTQSHSGSEGTYYITSYGSDADPQYYAVIFTQKFSVYGFAIPIPTNGGTGVTRYPVITVDSSHGSVWSSHNRAGAGTRVTITVKPDEGYRLKNLTVTDAKGNRVEVTANGDGTYSFVMPASKVEVEASFSAAIADPEDTGVADWLNTVEHSAYLFGYDDGTFGPNRNVTRAQVAAIFYRLLKDKNVTITKTFDDVPENAWYAKSVNTLASLGIIVGVGNNRYDPDRAIHSR